MTNIMMGTMIMTKTWMMHDAKLSNMWFFLKDMMFELSSQITIVNAQVGGVNIDLLRNHEADISSMFWESRLII